MVVVHARNIGEVHLNSGQQSNVTFEYENATFSPSAPSVVQTYPPYWVWKPVQSTITIRIPLHTARNASIGTYRFSAVAWNTTDHTHENGATETVVINVINSTKN